MGTGKVEVQDFDYPAWKIEEGPGVPDENVGRELPHGAIVKLVATNICGSDQHMVRGRTTAPEGLILGHEITGEVVETGPGVEFMIVQRNRAKPDAPPEIFLPEDRGPENKYHLPTSPVLHKILQDISRREWRDASYPTAGVVYTREL